MPGITLADIHQAGGKQLGGNQGVFRIDGHAVVVVGDPIASHGDSPHRNARMATGSSWMTINGIPVCRAGDSATCGHTTNGSDWFQIQ